MLEDQGFVYALPFLPKGKWLPRKFNEGSFDRTRDQAEFIRDYLQLLEHNDWHRDLILAVGVLASRSSRRTRDLVYKLCDVVLHLQAVGVVHRE